MEKTLVGRLAHRLHEDIRKRGFSPGDKYLTAAEAGERFSVSSVTANRAMRLLADKEILVRQRRVGTLIGPRFEPDRPNGRGALDAVHVLITADDSRAKVLEADLLVEVFREVLPGAVVHIHYLPSAMALAATRAILESIRSTREGVILLRSSREIQMLANQASIATVVFGLAMPGIDRLPSLDMDQRMIGRLMVECALDRDRRRFALLTHSEWRLGDNLLFEGIGEALSKAGLGFEAITVRSLAPDPPTIAHETRSLLNKENLPLVLLCRSDFHADIAYDVAREMGLKIGTDVTVVSGHGSPSPQSRPYPRVDSAPPRRQQFEMLADMLTRLAAGEALERRQVIMPVSIRYPGHGDVTVGRAAMNEN